MKIAIACDHGGFPLKDTLKFDKDDDYPDFARYIGQAIAHRQADRGVLVCGSGVGAAIAANKMKGVRACVCHDAYSAAQGVEHDDMNVLCLGARIVGDELAKVLVTAFAKASFSGEARHRRRLEKVIGLEGGGGGTT